MRRPLISTVLALAVSLPPVVHAQPAAAPQATQDEADRLFREANKLYKDKKYAEAEALYEQAFAKKRAHDIAANLGYAELNQRKYVEAATHIGFAVRSWPPTGKDDKKQYAVDRLAQAKAEVVTLAIEVSVGDAHVLVGEREVGLSPLGAEAFAEPGRVVVRAKRPGYRDAEQTVEGAKGSAQAVKLKMEAEAPPAATGSASATSSATVMSTATASATSTASTSATSTTSAATVPPPSRSMVPAFVMGGAALVSVALGGVFVGLAEGKRSERQSKAPKDSNGQPLCGQSAPAGAAPGSICDQLRAIAASENGLGNAGIAMFAVGGVAAAGAIGYWIWARMPATPARPTSSVVPLIAPDGGGIQWTGSF